MVNTGQASDFDLEGEAVSLRGTKKVLDAQNNWQRKLTSLRKLSQQLVERGQLHAEESCHLLPFVEVREAIFRCVKTVLAECPNHDTLQVVTLTLYSAKSAFLRRKCSIFLRVAIERWPRDVLQSALHPVMGKIRQTLVDADAIVRREGRRTLGAFVRQQPKEGLDIYHGLGARSKRAVLQEQPYVSNYFSAIITDRTADAATATSASPPVLKPWPVRKAKAKAPRSPTSLPGDGLDVNFGPSQQLKATELKSLPLRISARDDVSFAPKGNGGFGRTMRGDHGRMDIASPCTLHVQTPGMLRSTKGSSGYTKCRLRFSRVVQECGRSEARRAPPCRFAHSARATLTDASRAAAAEDVVDGGDEVRHSMRRCFLSWFFPIFVVAASFGAVFLKNKSGDAITEALRPPFCRISTVHGFTWETSPNNASCNMFPISGAEVFSEEVGSTNGGDLRATKLDAAAAVPNEHFETREGTPPEASSTHGQEVIVSGTGWHGDTFYVSFEGVLVRDKYFHSDSDALCHPPWQPLPWWDTPSLTTAESKRPSNHSRDNNALVTAEPGDATATATAASGEHETAADPKRHSNHLRDNNSALVTAEPGVAAATTAPGEHEIYEELPLQRNQPVFNREGGMTVAMGKHSEAVDDDAEREASAVSGGVFDDHDQLVSVAAGVIARLLACMIHYLDVPMRSQTDAPAPLHTKMLHMDHQTLNVVGLHTTFVVRKLCRLQQKPR